jgi:hypothetical protein
MTITAGEAPMKTALILSVLLVGLASNAYASSHSEKMYRDLIRPDGRPRSFAIYSAAVDGCYAQTHESRAALYDTPAYKACMLQKGYRYLSTKVVQDPAPATAHTANHSADDEWSAQHEANDDAQRQAQWQRQMDQENDDEQASMDAANASYAADAAQAAANVSAAASFDAQMTVGN